MNKVVKLVIPEPISHNGRERFVSGWTTAGVGHWLCNKNGVKDLISLSDVASTAYGRDSSANRELVRNNLSALRRWLAERGEFLLVSYGHLRRITAIKVCNAADENDRQMAAEQLIRLEARCEITEAERIRWEEMLSLPASEVSKTTE